MVNKKPKGMEKVLHHDDDDDTLRKENGSDLSRRDLFVRTCRRRRRNLVE
jgi:hypothetical protein